MWLPTRSNINHPEQSQKQARSLKIWIYEEEGLYYLCSENKGADQLRGYADCLFSGAAAQISETTIIYLNTGMG